MKMKHDKTAFCTDHSGLGGPVRYWTDVPREEQAKRVARTLARRKWGRLAIIGVPRLLSVHVASLESLYSCNIVDKRDFFNSKQDIVVFHLPPGPKA